MSLQGEKKHKDPFKNSVPASSPKGKLISRLQTAEINYGSACGLIEDIHRIVDSEISADDKVKQIQELLNP